MHKEVRRFPILPSEKVEEYYYSIHERESNEKKAYKREIKMWKTLNLPELNNYLKDNIKKEGQSSSDSDSEVELQEDEELLKSMPQMHFDLKPVIQNEIFKL